MQTIQLRTRVGSDGVLKLEIPLRAREADLEVVVVVQPSASESSRAAQKLSWEETYRQMAAENEDWTDWQSVPDEHGL